MSGVLIPTTTVAIVRPDPDQDPYGPGTETTVASTIPAHIGDASGSDAQGTGDLESVSAVALLPAGITDIGHVDVLVDERTGDRYEIAWVRNRAGLGLDHCKCGLKAVVGASG